MNSMLATLANAPHATYKVNYKTFKIAVNAAGFTGELEEKTFVNYAMQIKDKAITLKDNDDNIAKRMRVPTPPPNEGKLLQLRQECADIYKRLHILEDVEAQQNLLKYGEALAALADKRDSKKKKKEERVAKKAKFKGAAKQLMNRTPTGQSRNEPRAEAQSDDDDENKPKAKPKKDFAARAAAPVGLEVGRTKMAKRFEEIDNSLSQLKSMIGTLLQRSETKPKKARVSRYDEDEVDDDEEGDDGDENDDEDDDE
jgi:hypothetical protein